MLGGVVVCNSIDVVGYYCMSKLSCCKKNLITLERKQLRIQGLHHWKARAEAVKNISSVHSKNGEKVPIPKVNTKVYGNRKKNPQVSRSKCTHF